jgi:hypothetical protein
MSDESVPDKLPEAPAVTAPPAAEIPPAVDEVKPVEETTPIVEEVAPVTENQLPDPPSEINIDVPEPTVPVTEVPTPEEQPPATLHVINSVEDAKSFEDIIVKDPVVETPAAEVEEPAPVTEAGSAKTGEVFDTEAARDRSDKSRMNRVNAEAEGAVETTTAEKDSQQTMMNPAPMAPVKEKKKAPVVKKDPPSKIELVAREVIAMFKGKVERIFFRKSPSGLAYSIISKKPGYEDLVLHNITEHILNIPKITHDILVADLMKIIDDWIDNQLTSFNYNMTNLVVTQKIGELFDNCSTKIAQHKDAIVNYYVCNTPKFSIHFEHVFAALRILCAEERTEIVRRGKEWTNTYIGPRGLKSLEFFKRSYNVRAPFSIPKLSPKSTPELEALLTHLKTTPQVLGYVIVIHLLSQQFAVSNLDAGDLATSMMGG